MKLKHINKEFLCKNRKPDKKYSSSKTQIATDKFMSEKSYFFGSNSEIIIDINKSNSILALRTL